MLERKCVKSYELVQHCNVFTEGQVENEASKHVLRKEFSVDVTSRAWQPRFVCSLAQCSLCACGLKASHYFIQDFDATKLSERNRNQTE